jgi:hypothetical protein
MTFLSEDDLQRWLDRHGIDTSAWTKSVADLWKEYSSGEAVLTDDPPQRATSVVRVIIRDNGKVLFEMDQTFPDGRRRPRNAVLSEKMKPGETVKQAALRGVHEELGIAVPAENARAVETPVEVRRDVSPSYPGLPSRYTIYDCEVDVPGLPREPFTTTETGDAIRIHHWEWQPENRVRKGLDHE